MTRIGESRIYILLKQRANRAWCRPGTDPPRTNSKFRERESARKPSSRVERAEGWEAPGEKKITQTWAHPSPVRPLRAFPPIASYAAVACALLFFFVVVVVVATFFTAAGGRPENRKSAAVHKITKTYRRNGKQRRGKKKEKEKEQEVE